MRKLGFIVNPVAGMGGKVGLKGTDGTEILELARSLGATEEAPVKASKALKELVPIKDKIKIYTYSDKMGADELSALGFNVEILGSGGESTTFKDTEEAARKMVDEKVDLIMFAGGDGTARNIYNAVGTKVPVIGIPAGVKIHSGVFASHPKGAGEIALKYFTEDMDIKEVEVMDIDEIAFRQGIVSAKLYGYVNIPQAPELVQASKSTAPATDEESLKGIAEKVVEDMENNPDTYYIISSGTSIKPIMDQLGLENTLLGTDIVKGGKLIKSDVTENEILSTIEGQKAKIVVTVIGGQGYIFGRGNQQISAKVISKVGKDNIMVVATKSKLLKLEGKTLLVDTGDDEVNKSLSGYIKVIISYYQDSIERIKGL